MFALYDTFNNNILSRHRTIEVAVKAKAKFFRAFHKNNSQGSYLPVSLRMVDRDDRVTAASASDREYFEQLEAFGQ